MKLSKGSKARIDLMTSAEKKTLAKAARLLAETECITMDRARAILRWCNRRNGGY
jgi:hypothetical protein